ncbi:hypothetical protein [Janthinobacterium sp. DSP2-3-3]
MISDSARKVKAGSKLEETAHAAAHKPMLPTPSRPKALARDAWEEF